MKVIIAGSRTIEDYLMVEAAVAASGFEITEVVSGNARGVDRLGEQWAFQRGILITRFIPNWDLLGKKAGHIRNAQMGEYADALIALWDGKSSGTKNMIDYMRIKKAPIYVHRTP
jgi:threonine/homoserine efflux transporter RhtA